MKLYFECFVVVILVGVMTYVLLFMRVRAKIKTAVVILVGVMTYVLLFMNVGAKICEVDVHDGTSKVTLTLSANTTTSLKDALQDKQDMQDRIPEGLNLYLGDLNCGKCSDLRLQCSDSAQSLTLLPESRCLPQVNPPNHYWQFTLSDK